MWFSKSPYSNQTDCARASVSVPATSASKKENSPMQGHMHRQSEYTRTVVFNRFHICTRADASPRVCNQNRKKRCTFETKLRSLITRLHRFFIHSQQTESNQTGYLKYTFQNTCTPNLFIYLQICRVSEFECYIFKSICNHTAAAAAAMVVL